MREHRARRIGPASALDEQADRRPYPGKPIRLTVCPLLLATRAHDALAGTELDELRLAERIDLRRAHDALADPELDELRLAERIDLRRAHDALADPELDELRLAERIDLRRAHAALADPELDELRLAERIDLGADAAPGRRSCDPGGREDRCRSDGHDDHRDKERPAEDVGSSVRMQCPRALLDLIHRPASCLALDCRHDLAQERGLRWRFYQ
jgi:hypothetical protein